jgi:hypothetical protein
VGAEAEFYTSFAINVFFFAQTTLFLRVQFVPQKRLGTLHGHGPRHAEGHFPAAAFAPDGAHDALGRDAHQQLPPRPAPKRLHQQHQLTLSDPRNFTGA